MNPLTSVIFKNELRREKGQVNGITGKIFSALSFLIVFSALAGLMTWASIYITKRLNTTNNPYAFINIMLTGNFTILFYGSIFQVLNSLYFSKDLKILLRMPIRASNIIHSKILKMITSEYQMEIIMLAIPMIVYGVMNNVKLQFYLYIPIILLILPIIPICITSIIVAIIMRFTNKIKNKTRVMYLTIILSIVALNLVFTAFGGQTHFKLIEPIIGALSNFDNIMGIKNLLIYFVSSIVIYFATLFIISPIYLKGAIGAVINGDKTRVKESRDLRIEDFKAKTYKKAYIQKEFLIIKRSPIFFIQCMVMPAIMIIVTLGIVVALVIATKGIGMKLIKEMSSNAWFAGIFLAISQIFYMLNFSSIIAVSKEHRWAVLNKYIPIKFSKQLNMKLFIGKLTNFITNIAVMVFYYICTQNFFYTIILILISYGINSFGEKIKIFIDLKNPKIDWDNEFTMMKQDTNVMYELFYTILVMAIIITTGFIIGNVNIYLIALLLIITIINIMMNKYISKNEDKLFEKLF